MQLRPPVALREVEDKLRAAKKPNSTVEGDVLPRLMQEHHRKFAPAALQIYNSVFATNQWPKAWKQETAVIIPKPETLADCRNISCTAFLSKVLETFVLEDLRREIPEDKFQYGGMKGCGVDHLLVDLYDNMLGTLDPGGPQSCLELTTRKLSTASTTMNASHNFENWVLLRPRWNWSNPS